MTATALVCSILMGCAAETTAPAATNGDFISDTTIKTNDTAHGTQFAYLADDGTETLAYPGQTTPVRGAWDVRMDRDGNQQFCVQFGTNTYNPVTKTRGGQWECRSIQNFFAVVDEIYDGDVLRLNGATHLLRPVPRGLDISVIDATNAVGFPPPTGPNKINTQ
jgi:hypothetical protein